MSGDMYDWKHCDHRGIGNIGCPTCDPDKGRVMIRQQRLDNRDLRTQRDELAGALQELALKVLDSKAVVLGDRELISLAAAALVQLQVKP